METLMEGILVAPLDIRYIQVGFHPISDQVCCFSKVTDAVWFKTHKITLT